LQVPRPEAQVFARKTVNNITQNAQKLNIIISKFQKFLCRGAVPPHTSTDGKRDTPSQNITPFDASILALTELTLGSFGASKLSTPNSANIVHVHVHGRP